MKTVIDFFIFSNTFIALCAASLCMFSYEILQLHQNKVIILLFIFFSTLSAYNFHRIRGINHPDKPNKRTTWIKKHHKFATFLTLGSFLIAAALYFLLPNPIIILLMPLTLICLWYAVGIMRSGNLNRPLREVPFLKIFLISFVWTGACLMFPAVSYHGFSILSNLNIQLMAVAYSLFVFSLTLPFDIRDLKDDKGVDLLTIPGTIGVGKTKLLSSSGFFISAGIFILLYSHSMIGLAALLAFVFSCLLAIVLVILTSMQRSEYYFSFWLDGCLLLPFIFLHLFRHFI